MVSNATYRLVIFFAAFSVATTLRVDWNTNKGPILKPTDRVTYISRPPYREPAAVWEDQSDDIPNPNPYKYVLPPSSRSRVDSTFEKSSMIYESYVYGQYNLPSKLNTKQTENTFQWITSLGTKIIPNVGYRYIAFEPKKYNDGVNYFGKPDSHISRITTSHWIPFTIGMKAQGTYKLKTKKYKAYDKIKNVPSSSTNHTK